MKQKKWRLNYLEKRLVNNDKHSKICAEDQIKSRIWLTATWTPFSWLNAALISFALAFIVSLANACVMACARFCALSFLCGIDMPTPSFWIRSPQKNWSMARGRVMVGMPACKLAEVVPAPPWWMATLTRGYNQSCGTYSMGKMCLDFTNYGTCLYWADLHCTTFRFWTSTFKFDELNFILINRSQINPRHRS